MEEHSVKVYIYDISKGMARAMSHALLGKQLDGIWHTGIVVYGQEFFFGGMDGISSCHPGGTVLGSPDTIEDLGMTQIPHDMFMDYLHELSQTTFRGVCYHLLEHNCNNFSDEVAHFLTGKNIPAHITGLPNDFLQTPMGAMIKPFLDAMSVNPGGDSHPLFMNEGAAPASQQAAAAAVNPPPTTTTTTSSSSNPFAGLQQPTAVPKPTAPSTINNTPLPRFHDKQVLSEVGKGEGVRQWMSPADTLLIGEVTEYLETAECTWSLGRAHITLLVRQALDSSLTQVQRQQMALLLQNTMLHVDMVNMVVHDPDRPLHSFLSKTESLDELDILLPVASLICNCATHAAGKKWLLSREQLSDGSDSNLELLSKLSSHLVLHDAAETNHVGICLASLIATEAAMDEEKSVDLGSALLQLASKQIPSPSGIFFIQALTKCIEVNSEVAGLAQVMGLDISKQKQSFPLLQDEWDRLNSLINVNSI